MMPAEAHVWTAATTSLQSSGQLASYARLCSLDEQDRARRFVLERDRRAFFAAHGLVRLALSWCNPGVHPASWRFRSARYGRPEVAEPAAADGVRFNLSHSAEWVACVVTRELDCGIDVEGVGRCTDHEALAAWTLTPAEARDLAVEARDLRPRRFVERWTLKEALAKAMGLGLSLPFSEVGFALLPTGIRLLTSEATFPIPDGRWLFEQWAADKYHVVALAVRGGDARTHVVHHSVPHPA